MLEILRNIGLTDHEISVYQYLLENGQTKAGKVAKDLNLNRPMTYSVLESLIKKGLVNYIIINRLKLFKAAPPDKLVHYLNVKKDDLKNQEEALLKIIPGLMNQHKSETEMPEIEVYEGLEGFKTVLNMVIREAKDNYFVLGLVGKSRVIMPHFYANFNKRRAAANIKRWVISTKKHYVHNKKLPLTEARYLPKQYENPLSTLMWGERIAIRIWVGDIPILIVIKNKDVSKAFHAYFNVMWSIAKT
ncbi:MAG: helix-turn-helix domain-containing protein [Candidatus Woesearchaeota archaeon]